MTPASPQKETSMARTALNTADVKIDQKVDIVDEKDRADEIVEASLTEIGKKEYLERLAMGEEPVTIFIEPSAEENAPHSYYCSVNGRGAECLGPDGLWHPVDWVPVGVLLIMKRKYVEVLVRAKKDKITTDYGKVGEENPHNRIVRLTSSVANVQIMKDDNPRGPAYFAELRRRNF
jgi:hypothetical protein